MQFVREQEIFEELGGWHDTSVAEVNFLGYVFDDVNRAIVFFKGNTRLFVIPVDHGFPDLDGSAVRFYLAGYDVEERGFPDAVSTDNTDFFAPHEFVREIFQYAQVPVAFIDVFQFQNFLA